MNNEKRSINYEYYFQILTKFEKYFKQYIDFFEKTIQNKSINSELNSMLITAMEPLKNENGDEIIPENKLIELPENYLYEIKKQYGIIDKSKLVNEENISLFENLKGTKCKIGTGSKSIQESGINCMSIMMITCNRIEKLIAHQEKIKKRNGELSVEKEKEYKDIKDGWYDVKNAMMQKLMTCLYIYNNTVKKDYYSYGYKKDENGKFTLVLDLPEMTQFSVHFKNKVSMEIMVQKSKDETKSILEEKIKKLETKDQTSDIQEHIKKIKEKINQIDENANLILPEYEGKFYEYKSALPIKFNVLKMQEIINNSGVKNINNKQDLKNMLNYICDLEIDGRKINEREIHYIGVKSGFSKNWLQLLHKTFEKKYINNSKDIINESQTRQQITDKELIDFSKECVQNYNCEERNRVLRNENAFNVRNEEKNK